MKIRNLAIASTLLIGLLAGNSGFAQEERREVRNFNTKSLGEIHNEGVKYVLEHIKVVPPRDKVVPLIIRLTNEFCASSREDCGTLRPDWQPTSPEKFLSTLHGTEAFKENFRSLIQITQSNKTAMTGRMLQQYQISLDKLERTANGKLKGEERTRFLGALSVARASAIFWAPTQAGGLNGRHYLVDTNLPNGGTDEIDWGAVGTADWAGEVFGGPAGGVAASVAVLAYYLLA